jgi:hypothetical protein
MSWRDIIKNSRYFNNKNNKNTPETEFSYYCGYCSSDEDVKNKPLRVSANLTPDKCVEMIKKTLNKIRSEYIPGTLEYVSQNHMKEYKKLLKARETVNEVCKGCADEKYPTTIAELEQALSELYKYNINAITLYKEQKNV